MTNNNEPRSAVRTLIGLILGFLLLITSSGTSFYLGTIYGSGQQIQTVEVEVTREVVREVQVEVPRTIEVEVTREVNRSTADTETETLAPADESDSVEIAPAVVEEAPSQEPTPIPPVAEQAFNLDEESLNLFFEAWDIIEDDYDGDLPATELLNHVLIESALELLGDDYTRFSDPEVAARAREDMGGSFEGIGAFVRENDDGLIEIVRPMAGRPADLAGLRAGDIILAVDGVDVVGQSIDEVINVVRGPRDTEVILTIAREGESEPLFISIIRARIEIPTVESRMLDNNIGYVQLSTFNAVASDRMEEALADVLAENPDGLILDLRDNPGGFLDTAIRIGDLFLDDGILLSERNRKGLNEEFFTDNGDLAENVPMVVLVNAGSASASELIAGALRDRERAILIGETTFGKGSVQQLRTLSDGSEVRVTVARWYTPSGQNITDDGLVPDISVELPPEVTMGGEDDPQLQRAIDYLINGQ